MTSEIVGLTRSLFDQFYGSPPPTHIKGVALIVDGEVVAVGGVALMGGFWLAFTDIPEPARKHKRAIYKAGLQIRKIMDRCLLPVMASQDLDEPTSERLLTKFGFNKLGDNWRYL